MEKVFLNGEIIDSADAKVSVKDSGLLYGAGLFETMRCTGGKVFAIDDHLERLFNSADKLAINNPFDKPYMTDAIYKTLTANDLSNARLRLTLTNGSVGESDEAEPTLLITATDFQPYPAQYYQKGVTVVLTDYRQNPTDPTCGHKTTNFFARLITLNDARKKHAAEALWFTTDNRLAEGCISNVFLVKNGVVYTPKLDTPVLPGVTRKTICQITNRESIELVEKDLEISDVLAADEIFVANVIILILPVVRVEAHAVANERPGPITKKLMHCLKAYLSQEQQDEDKTNCS